MNHSVPEKICSRCGESKPHTAFGTRKDSKDGLTPHCKDCRREYDSNRAEARRKKWREDPDYRERNKAAAKQYREKNAVMLRDKQKKHKLRRRKAIIAKYGGRCECCGETQWEFLALDHLNGGGSKERASMGVSAYYRMLEQNERMEGYRLLCHNCNASLGAYGYCPHGSTIADPNDAGMLDIVGMSTDTPNLISSFIGDEPLY